RVGQAMACPVCAEKIRNEGPQNPHGAFVKAIIFGIGAAIIGTAIYAGFTIMTGIQIGFMSLLVGYIVGRAMMMGSGGYGGRKYQVIAAVLTYASVSMAFVPIAIHYYREHPTNVRRVHSASNSTAPASPTTSNHATADSAQTPADNADTPARPRLSFSSWLVKAFTIGLISPFLGLTGSPLNGLIGLVILFVGIQFAWKYAAGRPIPVVTGPY
ncbi:MAG TPA: hypothetical protein VGL89_00560, partial [Candidatus Koribacter sp.]